MSDLFDVNDLGKRLSENAIKVLEKRYLTKDSAGKITETVDGLFRRVAHAIAAPEALFPSAKTKPEEVEEAFFKAMTELDFLPNSPTLMNAGKPLGQLSACFVLPVPDSLDGIFEAIKQAALIHKSGGGTGFSFSRLRPANDLVATTSGVSSGPISFMKVFNVATETIKQGGTRRGANMGILRVDHPDIIDFIKAKEDDKTLSNFNISVGLTDEFMETLDRDGEYDLVNPRSGKMVSSIKASKIFNLIVERAWRNGEPGVVFLDRINREQPTPQIGNIESTNPCGEQPLLPYESCNLASINLAHFLRTENASPKVDFERLREVIHLAVRFLDNVIEVNRYPIPEIDKMTKANRKIGLGIMGWADLLIALRLPYNSEAALNQADEVMRFLRRESWEASYQLCRERGPFLNFTGSTFEKRGLPPSRNATVTTIAPTGTISLIAGCSSGIEPLFAVAFAKNVMDNEHLLEINQQFVSIAKENGFYSKKLMAAIGCQGNLKGISDIPDWVRKIFVTSHDISPEWHVRMQAAFQKNTDNAVSKTVNFPHEATIQDVETVFRLAYTLGCKGITVYRDGSRQGQVLSTGYDKGAQGTNQPRIVPRPRPTRTTGVTEKTAIGCGNLYITVNSDENGICEVFTSLGRGGGCPSQSEAAARLVSMSLRAGIDVREIIDQLKGIRCLSTLKKSGSSNGTKVLSCPDAIGRAIEQFYLLQKDKPQQTGSEPSCQSFSPGAEPAKNPPNAENESSGIKCPECSGVLSHDGGCVMCRSCGYSRCG